jgi:hypothetical protein
VGWAISRGREDITNDKRSNCPSKTDQNLYKVRNGFQLTVQKIEELNMNGETTFDQGSEHEIMRKWYQRISGGSRKLEQIVALTFQQN